MAGELAPGSYIRTEHLAADLRMSATPVREALMILHSEGTVQWEPRRGYRVVALSRTDVADLFLVQAWIAGELAARAVDELTDEDIDCMESWQQELVTAAAAADVGAVDRLNHQIHRMINKASGSQRLARVLNSTVNYVPLKYFEQIPGWSEASAHDHAPILKALRAKDAEASRKAMCEHVQHIGALLIEHLETAGVFGQAR
jgi:DNA-binding GntR family transcriptional regulator